MSRRFFLPAILLFAATAQAAPAVTQAESREQAPVSAAAAPLSVPEPRLPDLGGDAERRARYGAGYEARQGLGGGAQSGCGGQGMGRQQDARDSGDMTRERAVNHILKRMN